MPETLSQIAGHAWLSNLPSGWKIQPVKRVFRVTKEKSFIENPQVLSLTRQGVKERDVSGNEGQLAASYVDYASVKPGDFVLNPMDLIAGWVAITPYEGVVSNAYITSRMREAAIEGGYSPRFFEYVFGMYYSQRIFNPFGRGLGRSESGGGRWTLNTDTFLNFPVPVPPVEEQKVIADFLDRELKQIDILLEKQSKLVTTLTARRQATIDEYLGSVPHGNISKVCRLKDVATVFASNVDKKIDDEGIPVSLCNYVDVYYNDFITEDLPFMEATATRSEIGKFQLKGNWVILTKDSESELDIGISAFVEKDLPGVVCGYHLAILEPQFDVNGLYLKWALDSSAAKSHFARRANGLTRMALGRDAIATLPVTIPSLIDQQLISRRIQQATSEIDRLIRESKNLTSLLNERKRSLVSEAITGKIDCRGRN